MAQGGFLYTVWWYLQFAVPEEIDRLDLYNIASPTDTPRDLNYHRCQSIMISNKFKLSAEAYIQYPLSLYHCLQNQSIAFLFMLIILFEAGIIVISYESEAKQAA